MFEPYLFVYNAEQLRLKFYFVNAKVYKKSGFKDETGLFFLKSPFMI